MSKQSIEDDYIEYNLNGKKVNINKKKLAEYQAKVRSGVKSRVELEAENRDKYEARASANPITLEDLVVTAPKINKKQQALDNWNSTAVDLDAYKKGIINGEDLIIANYFRQNNFIPSKKEITRGNEANQLQWIEDNKAKVNNPKFIHNINTKAADEQVKNTSFDIDPRLSFDLMPIVGDVLLGIDAAKQLYNGNYKDAMITAGLFGVPSFSRKGLKLAAKGFIDKRWPTLTDKIWKKEVELARKEGRYIPEMTQQQIDNYIASLENNIPKYYDIANDRYFKKVSKLNEFYKLPIDFNGLSDIKHKINLVSARDFRKKHHRIAGGVFNKDNKFIDVPYNIANHQHILRTNHGINQALSHELDHAVQDKLKLDKLLPFNDNYRTYLKRRSTLTRDNVNDGRAPIYIKSKNYFTVNKPSKIKNNIVIDNNGNILEVSDIFKPLETNNKKYVWGSSPLELMSEVASYMDTGFKEQYKGLLFKDITDINHKNSLINVLSKKFKVNKNDMETMLLRASDKGYLKYGGKINY